MLLTNYERNCLLSCIFYHVLVSRFHLFYLAQMLNGCGQNYTLGHVKRP
jgi:hypothetical protein